MANDLGIVTGYPDGTFKPTATVTRAEFAAMMTRALAIPESALKGFKTSSFKDVATDHWAVAYLGYCNSKGIMTGYEDGTARPNQTITVNEAMTMICRALGYTNQAKELVGSWPANYIALAQQLSLYDDVAATGLTDRATAAQIVYNALTVPVKYINADGDTKELKDGKGNPVTMLGSLGSTNVNGGEGFVLLDTAQSVNFPSASQSIIDVTNYKGAYVSAFTDKDGNIIAIEKISTRLTGKWKTPDTFTVDGVDYTLKAGNWKYTWTDTNTAGLGTVSVPNPEWVSNGGLIAGGYVAGLAKGTYTIECKVNQKTIEQVYSVVDWDRANFSQFKASDLKIDKHTILVGGKTYTFPTDKANNIDMSKFSLEGVSSLEKIAKDNIVEVFTTDGTNNTLITKLSVGTTTVTGDCTKVSSDASEFDRDYTIDGKVYGYVGKAGKQPQVGTSGTAYLNYDGDVAVWDETDSASGNYAVVTKAWTEPKRGSMVTFAALLLKDGTSKDIEFKDKTTVTGGKTLANVNTVGVGTIVTYALDSEGKFSKFNIETDAGLGPSKVDASGEVYANNKFVSNTVVFQKDSDGDWSIGAVKNFETGKSFTALYSVVDTNEILAIAVNKDDVLHADKLYGVINSVSKMDDNGTATWYVDGFIDGKVLSAFVKDDIGNTPTYCPSTTFDGIYFGLYQITVDAENHVTIDDTAVASASCAAVAAGNNLVTDYEAKANGFSTITVSGSGIITLAKDVVVYIYDDNAKAGHKWSVGSAEELVDMKVAFFQTTSDSRDDGYYTVVLAWEE